MSHSHFHKQAWVGDSEWENVIAKHEATEAVRRARCTSHPDFLQLPGLRAGPCKTGPSRAAGAASQAPGTARRAGCRRGSRRGQRWRSCCLCQAGSLTNAPPPSCCLTRVYIQIHFLAASTHKTGEPISSATDRSRKLIWEP